MFMACLRDSKETERVMKQAKDMNDALQEVEARMATDDGAKDLINSCMWPHSPFARETLVGCEEREFKDLADPSRRDLKGASFGASSKPVEDFHRNVNVKARQGMNGNVSRHTRWHTCLTAPVLKDNEIALPEPTNQQVRTAVGTRLNNASYEVSAKDFSLGSECFKDILNTKDICDILTYTKGRHKNAKIKKNWGEIINQPHDEQHSDDYTVLIFIMFLHNQNVSTITVTTFVRCQTLFTPF